MQSVLKFTIAYSQLAKKSSVALSGNKITFPWQCVLGESLYRKTPHDLHSTALGLQYIEKDVCRKSLNIIDVKEIS